MSKWIDVPPVSKKDNKNGSSLGSEIFMGDYHLNKKGQLHKTHGLHWFVASLFVICDIAGGGIVALPTAVVRAAFWPGLAILVVLCVMATTSAVMLGKSWDILLRRFPCYRTHCRKPYPEIANRALGPNMKLLVSIFVNVAQFGTCMVFLLLVANNVNDMFIAFFGINLGTCTHTLTVALVMLPLTFLKSPEEFWHVIVAGMFSTLIAVMLVVAGGILDYSTCSAQMEMPPFKAYNVLLSLGTMLFTYGGHAAFPTIQHDMRKPHEFKKASIVAFSIVSCFNLAVVLSNCLSYGNSLRASVINSTQTFWIHQAVNIMITSHCFLTTILYINTNNQEAEELFSVPQGFGIKRVIVRTSVLFCIVMAAVSLPSFGAVLDLIGGSMVATCSFVFPCLFYLFLAASDKKAKELGAKADENEVLSFREMAEWTDRKELYTYGSIAALGLLLGIVASATAVQAIFTTHYTAPCYLKFLIAGNKAENLTSSILDSVVNCCGPFQNISRDNIACAAPKLDFY